MGVAFARILNAFDVKAASFARNPPYFNVLLHTSCPRAQNLPDPEKDGRDAGPVKNARPCRAGRYVEPEVAIVLIRRRYKTIGAGSTAKIVA